VRSTLIEKFSWSFGESGVLEFEEEGPYAIIVNFFSQLNKKKDFGAQFGVLSTCVDAN
jgi:hypothetical protein